MDASLATIEIDIGQLKVRALLDSGSSVSLIVADLVKKGCYEIDRNYFKQLVSATGNNLEVMGKVFLPILIGRTQTNHEFTVVSSLVTPLILGKDFLSAHKIRLDFGKELIECPTLGFISPFDPKKVVVSRSNLMSNQVDFKDNWKEGQDTCQVHDKFLRPFPGSVSLITSEPESSGCEECYIPCFNQEKFELPDYPSQLEQLILEYQDRFSTTPGRTNVTTHQICTEGSRPVRLPPRRMPAHYKNEVEVQIQKMLDQGIIKESNSPWIAPFM